MNCSTPGFPVLHYLLEFAQPHVHWVSGHTTTSTSFVPFCFCPQSCLAFSNTSFPQSFPVSQLFALDGKSNGASTSASVLPVNTCITLAPLKHEPGDFSGSPVAKVHSGVMGSIPDQGTRSHILQEKILHAITKIEVQVIPGRKLTTKSQEKVIQMKCAI